MVFRFPYRTVEINSKEYAIYFYKHMCDNCDFGNMMNPCSGYQAELCNKEADKIIGYLKNA